MDPRRTPEPRDPPDDPPKVKVPPQLPGFDSTHLSSDTAKPLPLVYGTVRMSGTLIERNQYTFNDPGFFIQWGSGVSYVVGQFTGNRGNMYVCTQAGVSGGGDGPTGTGSSIVDGTAKWDYAQWGYRHGAAIAYCEGQIFGARKAWQDKNVYDAYTSLPHETGIPGTLGLSLGVSGGTTRSPDFTIQNPDIYGDTAVLYVTIVTASSADLGTIDLEIQGLFCNGTADDVNPVDIAIDLITHTRRGAGRDPTFVDSASTGAGASSWRTYCTAAGFLFSWSCDTQDGALSWISKLIKASNTDAVCSNKADGTGWMIKFTPRGDQPITANGVTYTPNNTPLYNITEADLLEPVLVERINPSDTYNSFPVEFIDRDGDYRKSIVHDPDMADFDVRGLRKAPVTSIPYVMSSATAMQLSRIMAQQSTNIRNRYTIKVGPRFCLMEPTDTYQLSDSVAGITSRPVRVLEMEEDVETGNFTFVGEDWPAGAGAAVAYPAQVGDGFRPANPNGLTDLKLLPGQIPSHVISDGNTTRGSNVDNQFPNPTGENAIPSGADTTRPEWAALFNASPLAFSGSWVRQLSTAIHSRVLLGDKQASPTADQSQLGLFLPCVPGDQFYIEAMAKILLGTSGEGAGVFTWFLDSNNNLLGGSSTFVSITASASLRDPDSFLTNGGGEAGTVGLQASNWTLGGGNGLLTANDFAHSGSNSLKIINAAATDSFSYQDVALVGGQEYTLSGWIKTTALPTADPGLGAFLNLDIISGITSTTIVEKITVGADPAPTGADCGIAADAAIHDWTFVKCRFIPLASGTMRLYCQLGYFGAQSGTAWFDDVKLGPSFSKVTAFGTAPVGATKVMIGLWANCISGAITAQFDAIYARRADIAPLDHTRTVISPYPLSSGWGRILRALDGDASTMGTPQSGIAFYRGNIDPTDPNGGKPIIWDSANGDRATLTIFGSCGNVSISTAANWAQAIPLQITIQPKTNLDNLDAIRVISLKFYSGLGTFREEVRIPVTDRAYGSAGSPANALNALVIRNVFIVPGAQGDFAAGAPNHFNGYIRVTLYGAYGFSDSRDFGAGDGNVAGANMPAGATIPGVGAAGGSGGGGSSYCPAPEAMILMEDGRELPASNLRDGMRVQGYRNDDFTTVLIGTIRYATPRQALMRYMLELQDGRKRPYAKNHQFYSITRGCYTAIQYLKPGEALQGLGSCVVASIEAIGPGPVMDFNVDGTHTYLADGVLSHNAKASLP